MAETRDHVWYLEQALGYPDEVLREGLVIVDQVQLRAALKELRDLRPVAEAARKWRVASDAVVAGDREGSISVWARLLETLSAAEVEFWAVFAASGYGTGVPT